MRILVILLTFGIGVGISMYVNRGTTATSPFAHFSTISTAAAQETGERIASEFSVGKTDTFDRVIAYEQMMEHAIADRKLPEKVRRDFMAGVRDGLRRRGSVGAQTLESCGGQAATRLLRVVERPDGQHAMLRIIGDDGFNYLDLILRAAPDASVRAVDFFNYGAGVKCSDMVQGVLRNAFDTGSSAARDGLERIPAIQSRMSEGKFGEALRDMRSLPAEIGESRMVMMMRLQCAQQIDEQHYAAEIDLFERLFSGVGELAMVRLEGFILREQWLPAVSCIDALIEAVGGDAYLDAHAAVMLARAGDRAGAQTRADKALGAEPETAEIWWTVLTSSLVLDDHTRTAQLMTELEDRFDVAFDIEKADAYKTFAASPEYAQWKSARPAPVEVP